MRRFVHGSVFSGIGAAEIAASWMGWQNAFHCEIQEFPRRVLDYWFPNSESYEDITKTDFTKWQGRIDILTGGFPCQPFSLAGLRKGEDDDRYLWLEMLRAIRQIQPSWVVAENVRGIVTMVQPSDETDLGGDGSIFEENHIFRKEQRFTLDGICDGLERENYSVQTLSILACAVGAPHRRERIWIVAHRNDPRVQDVRQREDSILSNRDASNTQCERKHEMGEKVQPEQSNGFGIECACSERTATDSNSNRLWQRTDEQKSFAKRKGTPHIGSGSKEKLAYIANSGRRNYEWTDFPTQSPVCRGNDGIPVSLDNLAVPFTTWRQESIKAYGNAWVPQVAYEIFKAIQKIENNHGMERY